MVFQRTAHYCAPLNNAPITEAEQAELKRKGAEISARCKSTNTWFVHDADPRSVFDLSEAEREAFLEGLYAEKGIGIWKANFRDIGTSAEANEVVTDFIRRKTRARIEDPETAERLVPQGYGFTTRRVPLETNYYEVYNRPNVRLVSLPETPIEEITPRGIRTSAEEIGLDVIIFATGFDAVTGSFDRIEITGLGGERLTGHWADGPSTYLGVHASGFPNMFMVGGPLASLGNFGPALEYSADWITALILHMERNGLGYADSRPEAEVEWTDFVQDFAKGLLVSKVKSWLTGYNSNVEGRQSTRVTLYVGSAKEYRRRCDEERAAGYPSFELRPRNTADRTLAASRAAAV